MSDLFGNHIVGFPARRLNYSTKQYQFAHRNCSDICICIFEICNLFESVWLFYSCLDECVMSYKVVYRMPSTDQVG